MADDDFYPALGWTDDMRLHVPSCTVIEQEPVQRFSGLFDASGNKLMVVQRRERIGFVIFGEK